MSAGSFCWSLSIVTTTAPRARRKPVAVPALRLDLAQHGERAVGRRVVDVEDLVRPADFLEHADDLVGQGLYARLLVEARQHDRDVDGFVWKRHRRRSSRGTATFDLARGFV